MYLKISFDYPRPLTILVLIGMTIAILWSGSVEAPVHADVHQSAGDTFYRNGEEMPRGGPDQRISMIPQEYMQRLRLEQQILAQKTQILRSQLSIVEHAAGEGIALPELRDAHRRLIALFHDEKALESELLTSLRELQVSHDHAQKMTMLLEPTAQGSVAFLWPVEPRYGISAGFDDSAYQERFGFAHQAIDIPVEQGSMVYAPADGIVQDVADRGHGFNTLTIAHRGGIVTLYGHVREFLVEEGQRVRTGDPIARSGGMPGTKGAGMLSTGPHLHFEMIAGGEPVDPLAILPRRLFGPTWVRNPMEFSDWSTFSA